jgi:hypothetical protein
VCADVVDYLSYFDSKYARKIGGGDKGDKRLLLMQHFLHFIVTVSPLLHQFAPAVAWTPLTRSQVCLLNLI